MLEELMQAAPMLWQNWEQLFSDGENGLEHELKTMAGLFEPIDQPRTTFVEQCAALCFLEALEVGPQMINRGTLLNVEGIDTAAQRFLADLQVQTLSVLHKDSVWQWRNRLEALLQRPWPPHDGAGVPPGTREKKIVEMLPPRGWPKAGVNLSLDDPVLFALQTQFNKTQIGETASLEKWCRCEEAGEKVLDDLGCVPELLLARMVPEAAGDPFTETGRACIAKCYRLVSLNQRTAKTFDCMMDLREFPGDHQTLSIDISSVWMSRYATFIHHQATNHDSPGVSMFSHWAALGVGREDSTVEPSEALQLRRLAEWTGGEEGAGRLKLKTKGIRKGDTVFARGIGNSKVESVEDGAVKLDVGWGAAPSEMLAVVSLVNSDSMARAGCSALWRDKTSARELYRLIKRADCNSVWKVKANGERAGDVLGVHWQTCNASHEWQQPVIMEDKRS